MRDLSNLVKLEDIITSEHLVSLDAIVPKYLQKGWLASYEDNEYVLYTVTLFAHVADNFRTTACERGFLIRDFEYSPEALESRTKELEKLMQDQGSLRSSLLQWCYNSYGEMEARRISMRRLLKTIQHTLLSMFAAFPTRHVEGG